MKVATANGTFNVRWQYGNGGHTIKKKNQPTIVERNITTCDIRCSRPATAEELQKNPDAKVIYESVSTGNSVLRPGDTFDKRFGRRESFKKAIAGLPREQRKPIWDMFNNKINQ